MVDRRSKSKPMYSDRHKISHWYKMHFQCDIKSLLIYRGLWRADQENYWFIKCNSVNDGLEVATRSLYVGHQHFHNREWRQVEAQSLRFETLASWVEGGEEGTQSEAFNCELYSFPYFYFSPTTHIPTTDWRLSAPLHLSEDKVKSSLFLPWKTWGPLGPLCAKHFARCYVKVFQDGALFEDSHKRFMNVLNKSLAWVCLEMECWSPFRPLACL